ncbi:g5404 [Coccomyxa elongata]
MHKYVILLAHAADIYYQGLFQGPVRDTADQPAMDSDPFSANATSRMSSDFRSAISTSPLEQSLHNVSHLDRRNSAAAPSTVSAKRSRSSDLAGGVPSLEEVYPVWLEASPDERYLLLEDAETGDMLMPLIYMKAVFEANYSRKLSSLKHRLVVIPADAGLPSPRPNTYLYWQWAFEAPHNVKLLVRQELGEDNSPQGHLRLLLLPIVYNAMAVKEELRQLPLFKALQSAMRASAYARLLRHPPSGPQTPEKPPSELAAQAEQGTSLEADAPLRLFSGPHDLTATAAKYMYSFREAEETDVSVKRARMVHSGSHRDLNRGRGSADAHQPGSGADAAAAAEAAAAAAAELRREMREWKRRVEAQLEGVLGELAIVKNCIMQLYNVLLPDKVPTPTSSQPQPQPPPASPPPLPHSLALPALPLQHSSYQQVQIHGRHTGLPGRALCAPSQPPRLAGQLPGSRSGDSLVSRGAPCEGSNESAMSAMHLPNLAAPSLAAEGHSFRAHIQPQAAAQDLFVSNGLQALPVFGQQGSTGQPMSHSFMLGHPMLGGLGGGEAAFGMHMQQLSTPPHQNQNSMETLAAHMVPGQAGFSIAPTWRYKPQV